MNSQIDKKKKLASNFLKKFILFVACKNPKSDKIYLWMLEGYIKEFLEEYYKDGRRDTKKTNSVQT